jgi:hypothetical protein
VKKENQQTPANAFREALADSIQGSRHARKFIAQFVEALLKTRTSNLMKIAQAVESEAEADSVYRQIQRFLKSENQVAIDYLKLLKLEGKLKLVIDRTEWKFGSCWVNILSLSVAYKQVAIPLMSAVINRKGNLSAAAAVKLIKRFVACFGVERIAGIYADREFGTKQLLAYLIEEDIDFYIRLKRSHKTSGRSFLKMWKHLGERVKLRGKVKLEVFGLEVFVSLVKYPKNGKTEYLIVATRRRNNHAIEEYKTRWQIETMFGCLKSRGFGFEDTHLTQPEKIAKLLLLLGLGLCLAMLMGEFQTEVLKKVEMKIKKNQRYARSLFRIGLDALQNLLFNYQKQRKRRQLKAFIQLLSCT